MAALIDRDQGDDPLFLALGAILKYFGVPRSPGAILAGLPHSVTVLSPRVVIQALMRVGIEARSFKISAKKVTGNHLPALLALEDGGCRILVGDSDLPDTVRVLDSFTDEVLETPRDEAFDGYAGYAILLKPNRYDLRDDDYRQAVGGGNWFWSTIVQFKWAYSQALLASFFVGLFALASPLFVMNVYDRIVPNHAVASLWGLSIGVAMLFVFDFTFKLIRTYFVDSAGKRADLILSARIFQQIMDMEFGAKPKAAGIFANSLKDFETVREFISSTTLLFLVDLPFAALFMFVIFLIGGPVVFVVCASFVVVILLVGMIQFPLNRAVKKSMAEAAMRHGVLVEAISGLETIRSIEASSRMRGFWESYTMESAKASQTMRLFNAVGTGLAGLAVQMTTVGILLVGIYRLKEGEITMGGMIGCVLLSSRAIAPVVQLSGVVSRLHQTRQSFKIVNELMKLPVEHPDGREFVSMSSIRGAIEFENVSFEYDGGVGKSLDQVSFSVRPGEKVAVIGVVGSGKSTIARLMLGLYRPTEGRIRVDGIDHLQIDPRELRRSVGCVPQETVLFRGTLRDNILAAFPRASEAALMRAVDLSGLTRFVEGQPLGLDILIGERGDTLSGGQRQQIALARAILTMPSIFLLDEPTSACDIQSEQTVLSALTQATADATMILITHRISALAIVDRVIVMEAGRLIADGPKDRVLSQFPHLSGEGAVRPIPTQGRRR